MVCAQHNVAGGRGGGGGSSRGVCSAADEGEGEARIVEFDDNEDGLVASGAGIASLQTVE